MIRCLGVLCFLSVALAETTEVFSGSFPDTQNFINTGYQQKRIISHLAETNGVYVCVMTPAPAYYGQNYHFLANSSPSTIAGKIPAGSSVTAAVSVPMYAASPVLIVVTTYPSDITTSTEVTASNPTLKQSNSYVGFVDGHWIVTYVDSQVSKQVHQIGTTATVRSTISENWKRHYSLTQHSYHNGHAVAVLSTFTAGYTQRLFGLGPLVNPALSHGYMYTKATDFASTWSCASFHSQLRGCNSTIVSVGPSSYNGYVVVVYTESLEQALSTFTAPASYESAHVGPVLNQGRCGNCYQFSTTEMIADRMRQQGYANVHLSQQALLSCTAGQWTCNGGDPYKLANYLASDSLVTSACFPYTTGSSSTCGSTDLSASSSGGCAVPACPATCPGDRVAFSRSPSYWAHHGYHVLVQLTLGQLGRPDTDTIKRIQWEVAMHGPLAVSIAAGSTGPLQKGFNFKNKAVFTTADCSRYHCSTKTDHSVLIVGWGTQSDGKVYWVAQNSWGTSWGDGGLFRIEAGVNLLGIEAYVVGAYPDPTSTVGRRLLSVRPEESGDHASNYRNNTAGEPITVTSKDDEYSDAKATVEAVLGSECTPQSVRRQVVAGTIYMVNGTHAFPNGTQSARATIVFKDLDGTTVLLADSPITADASRGTSPAPRVLCAWALCVLGALVALVL